MNGAPRIYLFRRRETLRSTSEGFFAYRSGTLRPISESFLTYGIPVAGGEFVKRARSGLGGQTFVPESGLYLLGERALYSGRGMFLAPDPVTGTDAHSSLSGRYVYGYGDPLSYRDPNGQLAWFVPIIIGAIIGGTIAAAQGGDLGDVLRGAAMGAVGGAFYWVGVGLGGVVLGFAVAGAGSGAANAALFGGNVEQAVWQGAMLGAISSFVYSNQISIFGNQKGWAGTADYLVNSSLRGAAAGGAYAAFTGNDIGDSAFRGAAGGAVGAIINMGIGHAWGYLNSGNAPKWEHGAWVYEAKARAISIGNVITGEHGTQPGQLGAQSTSGNRPSNGTIEQHELGHIPQSMTLGAAYLPAVGLSYVVGGAWGAIRGEGFEAGTHIHSLFENESGFNPVPSY